MTLKNLDATLNTYCNNLILQTAQWGRRVALKKGVSETLTTLQKITRLMWAEAVPDPKFDPFFHGIEWDPVKWYYRWKKNGKVVWYYP